MCGSLQEGNFTLELRKKDYLLHPMQSASCPRKGQAASCATTWERWTVSEYAREVSTNWLVKGLQETYRVTGGGGHEPTYGRNTASRSRSQRLLHDQKAITAVEVVLRLSIGTK